MNNSMGKKNQAQAISDWSEQNQSNTQFNFNLKRCRPKGSNNTTEKLRIPSSLISRVKKN